MTDEILFEEPKVKTFAISMHPHDSRLKPDQIAAFGAYGCFEEKSSIELYNEAIGRTEDEDFTTYNKKIEKVLDESAGRGHGSVLDQSAFTYSIENVTRAATLQLCLLPYLSHLQQSLRRATANRAFYVPKAIRESELFNDAKEIQYDAFKNYIKWGEADKPEKERSEKAIPLEDARYPLPLYTKTNIQSTGDARELTHLHMMNKQGEVPSCVQELVDTVVKCSSEHAPGLFKERAGNRELLSYYPSAQLYSSENESMNNLISKYDSPNETVMVGYSGIDCINEKSLERAVKNRNEAELANLKHIHFEFLTPMSLASYHQATRQRTWDHSLESIYDAAERGRMKIPPKFESSEFADEFVFQNLNMSKIYKELVKSGVARAEAIGVEPHSLMIYDLIHINGWNAIHSIGKRTCTKAQWEIRKIANDMASQIKKVAPMFENYAAPQCMTYGKCPERNPCKSEFKQ